MQSGSIRFTAIAGLLLAPTPAAAMPHVYADMFLGVSSLESCIEDAERVGRKHGFTDDIEVVEHGNTLRDFYADHKNLPVSFTVSCSTRLGGAAYAVAGMNNDITFKIFQKIFDDF